MHLASAVLALSVLAPLCSARMTQAKELAANLAALQVPSSDLLADREVAMSETDKRRHPSKAPKRSRYSTNDGQIGGFSWSGTKHKNAGQRHHGVTKECLRALCLNSVIDDGGFEFGPTTGDWDFNSTGKASARIVDYKTHASGHGVARCGDRYAELSAWSGEYSRVSDVPGTSSLTQYLTALDPSSTYELTFWTHTDLVQESLPSLSDGTSESCTLSIQANDLVAGTTVTVANDMRDGYHFHVKRFAPGTTTLKLTFRYECSALGKGVQSIIAIDDVNLSVAGECPAYEAPA